MKILISDERRTIIEEAIAKFGYQAQYIKTIEELGELQVEIARWLNAVPGTDVTALADSIVEEAADVLVMIIQIGIMAASDKSIEAVADQKIDRLKERMATGFYD